MADLKIINFQQSETKIYTGKDAIQKIHEMGLTYETLSEPFINAINIKKSKPKYAMPMEKNFTMLFESVKLLREKLIQQGWSYDDKKNFNQTISPNNKFMITVSSGDCNVGHINTAITKNQKGAFTAGVIEMNNLIQLSFQIPNSEKYKIKYNHRLALNWFLMFYYTGHSIQIELSLPRYYDTKKKKVIEWYERILLPDILLNNIGIKNTPNNLNNLFKQDLLKPLCNNEIEDIDITKK